MSTPLVPTGCTTLTLGGLAARNDANTHGFGLASQVTSDDQKNRNGEPGKGVDSDVVKKEQYFRPRKPRWWFQIFVIFTSIWGRFPF